MPKSTIISDEDFQKFREFFYRKTGMLFEDSKRYFVDKRLLERMTATGCESFRTYFTMLRFQASGAELQTLINAMTVNETYFFREEYQFRCLVDSILKEIITHHPASRPIRIWSVPSSSGEEPYGIAMYLLEHWPQLEHWDVEIISSDIDTRILEQARAGLYASRAIQHVPAPLLKKYFRRMGAQYQISQTLREAVEFTRVNVHDTADMRSHRHFDVIFCRNLLIYFDDLSRKKTAESFFDALNPGGFICLGHSESMSRISPLFQIRRFPEAIVYQKPLEAR
ncbi:chemotaxis protein methyltransferase CheR [Ectothiorhodospira magna]|uniref:Chemotaxis protein methyltransferase n=1 Tax=Ectothiorhodospira magna TaxID=867345 RepID=A0A1H9ASI4_9GAMM|nr:protein-glutamate O-methyltransferase CheR [Ectothiorhodospira magna]SEP79437.1 chemotaxis protein methyltransferase CheR [Ectothiorhodospira magna]